MNIYVYHTYIYKMQKLIQRRKELMNQFVRCGSFVRGSINCVCGKCSRANCVCEKKTSTKAYRLTYKDNQQKTQIIYIAKNRLPQIKQLLANYTEKHPEVKSTRAFMFNTDYT